MERTYLMVKPDGVQRGLMGEIVTRLEKRGFKPIGLKFMRIPRALAETHYGEHKGKPFYAPLIDYITSGPVLAMVWEGEDVVAVCRQMMGKTNPKEAAPGTIRGDFGIQMGRNIIHGSDSVESAQREISLFFTSEELLSYDRCIEQWIYE